MAVIGGGGSSPAPLTAAELADRIETDTTTAEGLLTAAWPIICDYAPNAPPAVRQEALIRFAGWLAEAPATGVRSEAIGPLQRSYMTSATGGFSQSGARALLGPFRARRAGLIG